MPSTDPACAALVAALDLEWDDVGPEQAALAAVGAELIRAESLSEAQYPRVVALLSEGAQVTARELRRYPALKIVSEFSTGYDGIDLETARALGIAVTNVAGYCTEEVADHTLALALTLLRNLRRLSEQARAGEWVRIDKRNMRRCADLSWGVIGFGRIGTAVARRAAGFGFGVCAFDPQLPASAIASRGAHPASLDELLAESDVVSIHAARTGRDDHMLDRGRFALMKPTAFLVNVARGAFVDEDALADALDAGALAGAALDVLTEEPPDPSNRLLGHPRVLVTPHAAWYSDRAEAELRERGIGAVVDVLSGRQPADLVAELR
jgi:D-3-phosphoglycerate dehydrogenase / 2-oxoglutarate reductase